MAPLPRRTLYLALLAGVAVLTFYSYGPPAIISPSRALVDSHPHSPPLELEQQQPAPVVPPLAHVQPPPPPPPAVVPKPPPPAAQAPAPPPSTPVLPAGAISKTDEDSAVDAVPAATRLTLIAIWSPQHDRTSNYIANFLASVAANPSISLLLVKVDKYKINPGGDCGTPLAGAAGYANVQEVCLSLEQYHEHHVRYLCGEWACTDAQRKEARAILEDRQFSDRVNSHYRPFRAEVFGSLLNPDTPHWGWVDLDVQLGSFERMFPWDLAPSFDVIMAGWPTGINNPVQVFMPGHLTVFKRSKEVARAFLDIDRLKTFESWKSKKWEWDSPEESEYSHHLLTNTPLTFLRLGAALADTTHHVSALAPGGIYALENVWWADRDPDTAQPLPAHYASTEAAFVGLRAQINGALAARAAEDDNAGAVGTAGMQTRRVTFSAAGVEKEVALHAGVDTGATIVGLWFPKEFAVAYESTLGPSFPDGGRDMRRFLMRRAPRGPVVERFEPEQPLLLQVVDGAGAGGKQRSTGNSPWMREALYNHFQHEKYQTWWALPDRPLKLDERMYIDRYHGAHVWDEHGKIAWESPRSKPAA